MLATLLRDGVLKDIAVVRADAATAASGMSMLKVDVEQLLSMVEREEALAAEERADLLADRDKWRQLAEELGMYTCVGRKPGWDAVGLDLLVSDLLLTSAVNPRVLIRVMLQKAERQFDAFLQERGQ